MIQTINLHETASLVRSRCTTHVDGKGPHCHSKAEGYKTNLLNVISPTTGATQISAVALTETVLNQESI